MGPGIITYEALYDMLRKEKYQSELQRVDPGFFEKVVGYLKDKQAILESQQRKSGIFSSVEVQKTSRQLENVYRILNEIYDRRENKVIQLAMFKVKTNTDVEKDVFLAEEEKMFDEIVDILKNYRAGVLDNILTGKMPKLVRNEPKELKIEKNPSETKLVRFLQAVPQFVGDDLQIYGPFSEEDMANLPKGIGNLLIKKKRAEGITIK